MTDLLLDTHIWIWFVNGDGALPKKLRDLISESSRINQLYLAAISPWELSMLVNKQKLSLNMPVLEWIKAAISELNINLLNLSVEIAAESCQLPGDFHGDPADRMIVATARVHHLTLLTKDQHIVNYSKRHHVKTLSF